MSPPSKYKLIFLLLAVQAIGGEQPGKTDGIDLFYSLYISDGKGNFHLVIPEKTAFDSNPETRRRYLEQYEAGFRSGLTGVISTYCPSAGPYFHAETAGWSAGQLIGERVRIEKSIKSHK